MTAAMAQEMLLAMKRPVTMRADVGVPAALSRQHGAHWGASSCCAWPCVALLVSSCDRCGRRATDVTESVGFKLRAVAGPLRQLGLARAIASGPHDRRSITP